MKTIVHLTAPGTFGGLERVLEGLAAATASKGYRVLIGAVLDKGTVLPDWLLRLSRRGVDIEPVFLPPRAYLQERRIVRKLLQRQRVFVVHTHGYRADVLHGNAARQLGIPLVSTAHGFASTGAKGLFFEWLQLRAWSRGCAVVAVSRPLVEVLARAGVPRNIIECIPNGVVPSVSPKLDRVTARRALGLPEGSEVIGWVGRLSSEKAPELMVKALALCTNRQLQLCVIGDGPLLDACRRLGEQMGLSARLKLAGFVANASDHFAAFDVLALSSHTEGTPMVLLEATMARVPIVATAVGGVPDLVGVGGGWLVPPGSAEELARALDAAVGDPAEAARRAQHALSRVQSAAQADDWVGKYVELYERVGRRQ